MARPPLPEDLSEVKSASLSDAVRQRYGHRAHVLDLVTPTPGRVLYGEAITMAFVPVRDDRGDPDRFDFFKLFDEALGDEPAGKVLVAANYGAAEGAVAGGTRLARAERAGLAGLLTNGRLRDFDEVRAYGFAAYCRGETAYAGSQLIMPYAVNVPVALDGVTVLPGDHVYADEGGAVVLPGADVAAVLEAARAIEAEDARKVAAVLGKASGSTRPE